MLAASPAMPARTRHSMPQASPCHHASHTALRWPRLAVAPQEEPPCQHAGPPPHPSKIAGGRAPLRSHTDLLSFCLVLELGLLAPSPIPPGDLFLLDAAGHRLLGGRHQSARRPRPRGPLPIRFNRYVIRPDDPDACWGWSAALHKPLAIRSSFARGLCKENPQELPWAVRPCATGRL
jgi:hypothetical protein